MSETFKDRLNKAMALRNMKAIDLSEKTGISKARISQYVNGVYTPKSKSTYIIAQVLISYSKAVQCASDKLQPTAL